MTRDEILNMPAGREMDFIVARDIMGRKPYQDELGVWFIDESETEGRNMPFYSIKIGAAWEVVRRFPEIHMEHSERNDFAMISDNFDTAVTCETMPLAICRAALLAMEAK